MNVQPKPSFDDCLPDSRLSSRMAGDPGGARAPRTWTARDPWPIELEVDPWRP